ncbi:MAG: B-box zinc finger protein, partial [Acidobacteriota bacterium]|nr:B-box zinc finger protein [Acidobacteriota bacterium]
MNCANHPDRERTAFCQNCGKPLCSDCIRTLGSSLFCEPCYALRIAAPPVPPAGVYPPPSLSRPGIAALLGFIPGVGAMYNGQYAKGIVHLLVFALLVSLADHNGFFGLLVAGWTFYMVIEAYHTARARRDGAPLPNPFGFNELGDRFGFGRSWTSPAAPGAPFTPPAPFAPAPGSAGTPPPAGGPYSQPWGSPYTPPTTQWGAPSDAWAGIPHDAWAGVPPVPPAPPTPDLNT